MIKPIITECKVSDYTFNPDNIESISTNRYIASTNMDISVDIVDKIRRHGFKYDLKENSFISKFKFENWIINLSISKDSSNHSYLVIEIPNYKEYIYCKYSYQKNNPLNLIYNFNTLFDDTKKYLFRTILQITDLINLIGFIDNKIILNINNYLYIDKDFNILHTYNTYHSDSKGYYHISRLDFTTLRLVKEKLEEYIPKEKTLSFIEFITNEKIKINDI